MNNIDSVVEQMTNWIIKDKDKDDPWQTISDAESLMEICIRKLLQIENWKEDFDPLRKD